MTSSSPLNERRLPSHASRCCWPPSRKAALRSAGIVSDHGADTDGDGLFNQLVIDVEVAVDVNRRVSDVRYAHREAGTTIEQVRVEQELQPGLQTVSLAFDGRALFASARTDRTWSKTSCLRRSPPRSAWAKRRRTPTIAYAHTAFQRPPCLLTGNVSDYGINTDSTGLMPYEALVVAVEADMLFDADMQANAKLYSEDGAFVAACSISAVLTSGLNMLEFQFSASRIFRSGKPGPYSLRLLSLWGTTLSDAPTAGSPVWLDAPDVVAVTQPYRLEDFGVPPRYTIGGTVTGLAGAGLVLYEQVSATELSPGNGAFTFSFPKLSGSSYDVRIRQQPMNPIQVCSITNGAGIVGGANVTDIMVDCVTPVQPGGLDPSFGTGGKVTAIRAGATAMALQSDGKIVVVGGDDPHTLSQRWQC